MFNRFTHLRAHESQGLVIVNGENLHALRRKNEHKGVIWDHWKKGSYSHRICKKAVMFQTFCSSTDKSIDSAGWRNYSDILKDDIKRSLLISTDYFSHF